MVASAVIAIGRNRRRLACNMATSAEAPVSRIFSSASSSSFVPADNEGNLSASGTGFAAANFKGTINGYIYGNGPLMTMKKSERVRWYLLSLGEGINFHTPHWHGNVVMDHGKRTDVVTLMPAQMNTVDMVPDDPGIWLYHCHIDEHMDAGMVALYKVEP